ncbi:MAG: spore germination protein [Bacillaceae bacterium]|nr:spore germination protein [Bacillaceae bacterium]
MEKEKINPFQLFVLMVLFELGSAIVIAIGVDAKQGAWLSIFLGLLAGLVIYVMYYYLYKQFPTLPLTVYVKKLLGKFLGSIIGFSYIVYFLYLASRVLRDFGDLLLTSTLPETPLFVINVLMICTIVYLLYHGIEVFARTGEFYFLILLLIGLFANLLIFLSDIIDLQNLFPLLGDGWRAIVLSAFPVGFTFPFGEIVVFTMILPHLNSQGNVLKIGWAALLVSGVVIIYTTMMNFAVLGVDIATRATFPLLATVSKIRVADFLERLDALVVVTLVITMFFKIAVFMYASILGIKHLFNVKSQQSLVLPIGIVVIFTSVTMAGSFTEHLEEGVEVVPYLLHLPFQIGIPVILLIVSVVRRKVKKLQVN